MRLLSLLAMLLVMSACTANNQVLLDEKTATPDMIGGKDVINPLMTKDAIQDSNQKTLQTNNQAKETKKNMANPRTTINEKIELKDLAAEYTGAIVKTSLGDIKVKFYGEDSPLTVNNFMNLAESGFYDGTRFHRVINDFMIQAGDPNSRDEAKKSMWGTGGPDYRFKDEFNSHTLVKGSFAMANAGPATNGSQFFIVTKEEVSWLDGKHTNFGEVVDGMDIVEKIEASETGARDVPVVDILINSIELTK